MLPYVSDGRLPVPDNDLEKVSNPSFVKSSWINSSIIKTLSTYEFLVISYWMFAKF
jgi:hypothetical protein